VHEFSLANDILEAASGKLRQMDSAPGGCIRIRIGELTGVDPGNLRFCLDAARAGTPLEGLEIEVEAVKPKLVCPSCGEVEYTGRFDTVCPRCGDRVSGVAGGRELDVQLEYEDPPRHAHED